MQVTNKNNSSISGNISNTGANISKVNDNTSTNISKVNDIAMIAPSDKTVEEKIIELLKQKNIDPDKLYNMNSLAKKMAKELL